MIDFLTRARAFYSALEPARQTQLWLGAAAAVLTVVGLWWWMTTEPYAVILEGTPDEIGEAAAALREADIPMRAAGNTLSVPEAHTGDAAGVLGAHKMAGVQGIFDNMRTGLPPRVQDVLIVRQKQADLAASIASMSGITGAQVNLEPGEQPLFGDEDTGARASVFIERLPGSAFGREQARAVQRMVAGAVPLMDPSDVVITDNMGSLLAGDDGDATDRLDAMRARYEKQARRGAREVLRPLVGGALAVNATARIERRSMETQIRDLDPNRGAAVSENIRESSKEKTAPPQGGAPGVDAETPERAQAQGNGGTNNNEEQTNVQTNMEYKRTTTVEVRPPGALEHLAMSVTVDENALSEVWGVEAGTPAFTDKLTTLEQQVRNAVGINEERGDVFSMAAMPFAPVQTVQAPPVDVGAITSRVAPFVPYALALLALLLAFFFVVRPLMAKVTAAPLRTTEVGPDGKALPLNEDEQDADLAERLHRLVENFEPVDSEDLNKLVAERPEASAKVLADWASAES